MQHQQESAMRSVRSTPRCPSASSPVRPGAERATTKVSCTCFDPVSTCPRVHLHTASGERDDTCERYSSVPECFKPCPAKCEQSFRDQVTITCTWCSVVHHNPIAGGEPAVREVRLLPRGAQLLLHPLLPGVHGPGQGQQVSQTGGMVTP